MNISQNLAFFLLILFLCTLSGCVQSFGTVVPSPQVANEEQDGEQSGIAFYDDFDEAQSIAVRDKKPMILFFYSPNCVFSRQMLKETFCDENVSKLSQNFVWVKIDESRHQKMCDEYDVKGTPTIQFMNPQGTLLQRLKAKKSPAQLILQMQIALESHATREQNRL